jgi:hypothetical protein
MAWDFPENSLNNYKIGKYNYKAMNYKNAKLLSSLRKKISDLCDNMLDNIDSWINSTNDQSYLDGVFLFISIHKEHYYDPDILPLEFAEIAVTGSKVSRYLLGEIPKGTPFDGINKPRMRYIDNKASPIGKDGNSRPMYRHIFLNLDISDKKLAKLIIHELAHTMANHNQFRNDDHHADFIWCEKLITNYWPK